MLNPVGEILDVRAALEELASVDARLASVVEMRYFASMSDDEIAEVLARFPSTVWRDWDKAGLCPLTHCRLATGRRARCRTRFTR